MKNNEMNSISKVPFASVLKVLESCNENLEIIVVPTTAKNRYIKWNDNQKSFKSIYRVIDKSGVEPEYSDKSIVAYCVDKNLIIVEMIIKKDYYNVCRYETIQDCFASLRKNVLDNYKEKYKDIFDSECNSCEVYIPNLTIEKGLIYEHVINKYCKEIPTTYQKDNVITTFVY
jgi:hypothetical protein